MRRIGDIEDLGDVTLTVFEGFGVISWDGSIKVTLRKGLISNDSRQPGTRGQGDS